MVHYSVLVPQRNSAEEFRQQLPALTCELDRLTLPYEIICIDDGSTSAMVDELSALLDEYPRLRLLRFDEPRGVSAALCSGIQAAKGDIVIAIEVGAQYAVSQIPHLIARLSRGDLVYGRRPATMLRKAWQRITRVPRWLLLGLDVKDPDCLFWVARREAVADLQLARGMFRYLPTLVSMRGYRVTEVAVDFERQPRSLADARPNPGDLLAIWWLRRRWISHTAHELAPLHAMLSAPYRRESA
jgi:dolichol-phosphate mannosyltransferase